ncbi:MAG TPA: Ig-like domain-containing protein, partial [Planctomycetaceae bacterium]
MESRQLLSATGSPDAGDAAGGDGPGVVALEAGAGVPEPAHGGACCCALCGSAAPDPGRLGAADSAQAAAAAAAAGVDLSTVFRLHSRPGATKVIYLDFDGHVTRGTSWNSNYNGGADIVSPAYDRDGDPTTFSDAERAEIHRIWQRVAEDFAPFDVDVTTEDPGLERLRNTGGSDVYWGVRAVQTADKSWITDDLGNLGGIAYTGSFTWNSDTPVFSFNAGEAYAAETLSHEVGHALGLAHDGTGSATYYYGHGSGATGWAPIMGAGFGKSLSHWSKGEYPGATQAQDDLATITTRNGFGYRPDDHGGTLSAATALAWAGAGLSASGVIERDTDLDAFAIDVAAAGTLSLSVSPFERGPNLDVLAELFDAAGRLVASSNPLTALNASLSVLVTAGRYYLRVDGVGKDATGTDPGYSDYGSLGQYTVSGGFAGATAVPTVTFSASPAAVAEDSGAELVFTFARTGDLSAALTVNFAVGGSAAYGTDYAVTGAASFSGTAGSVTFAAGSGTATLRVRPTADATAEPDETVLLTLLDAPGYDLGSGAAASGTISNDDISNSGPVARDDSATIAEDGRQGVAVLANDSDTDGDPLSITAVNGTAVTAGTVVSLASGARVIVGANGTLTYDTSGAFRTLRQGESATDSFTYTVSDGQGGSASATVALTVVGGGADDLIGFYAGGWRVGRSTGTAFDTTLWAKWADVAWSVLRQADFDGDGRTDVLGMVAGIWYVGLSADGVFLTASWGRWANVAWTDVLVGDLDGDGRADLLARYAGQWWGALSTGAGFAPATLWTSWRAVDWEHATLRDVTGDG